MIDVDITPLKWLFAGVTTALGGVFALGGTIEPLISFAASTASFWLPIATLGGFQLAPEIGLAEVGRTVALVAILAYVSIKAAKLIDAGAERLQEK